MFQVLRSHIMDWQLCHDKIMKKWIVSVLGILSLSACMPRLSPAREAWEGVPQKPPPVNALKDWHMREARIRKSEREAGSRDNPQSPLRQHSHSPIVSRAQSLLGIPYQWGGESPVEGFDCSGLIHYVFNQEGISLPRLANEQYLRGENVSRVALREGDLVFFSISGKIVDHVGIYAGNEQFIHAPRTGRTVSYEDLNSQYFKSRYRGAKRIY